MRADDRTIARRGAWTNRGARRPDFAHPTGPGEESVWDYPRPPRLVADDRPVEVRVGDTLIARSDGCLRVLETASPPTVYLPPSSIEWEHLRPAGGGSHCEWKGTARYYDVVTPDGEVPGAAWAYDEPYEEFASLAGHVSFYPARVACWLGGERVAPQPGRFYGGWVTPEVIGPFKGEPGSEGW